MAITTEPFSIGSYVYIGKADHRDGTKVKSQWTIPVSDENAAFALGITSGWISGQAAWGLHLSGGVAGYLGRSSAAPGPSIDLCVAYFQLTDTCHGYPSDPGRSVREVPPEPVKNDWISKGYLRSAVVRKLGRVHRNAGCRN